MLTTIIAVLVTLVIAIPVSSVVTSNIQKKSANSKIGNAEEKAREIIDEALTTADNIMTFKLAVKTIAKHHGMHATFMPKPRKDNPELEKMVRDRRKKFVRYEEGAKLYSMGVHTFEQLAKDAKAVYHVKRIVLVNLDIIDDYLEAFRDEE